MEDIINYEEFMACLEDLYQNTDYGIHPTPATGHACNLRPLLEKQMSDYSEITMLDVGCGHGDLMEFYKFSGWTVAGTEIVNYLLAGELLSFEEVYPYSIGDLKLIGDNQYDFVFFVNVLDHVWNPEDIVIGVEEGRRIAKYGIVVVCDGEENFQTIDIPKWQWRSMFTDFKEVDFYEHESGFLRVLAFNDW